MSVIDLDIAAQRDKLLEAFRRDVTNICSEAAMGKLGAASARDLIAYIKLAADLQREQDAYLAKLPLEELEKMKNANAAPIGGGQSTSNPTSKGSQ